MTAKKFFEKFQKRKTAVFRCSSCANVLKKPKSEKNGKFSHTCP